MKMLLILAAVAASFFSCGPSGTPDPNNTFGLSVDNTKFFTITFNGRTLTTYGLKSSIAIYQNFGKNFVAAQPTTLTSNGQVYTQTIILAQPNGNIYNVPNGNVEGYISGTKIGGNLGLYTERIGGRITDKTSGSIYYDVDNVGSTMNITSIDNELVRGTFSVNLISGPNRIPATGSFCVNLNQ